MTLILIDKPEGPTSHAVVAALKRALKVAKVGHLGTLDPFASGLLPVMIGQTARLADEAMDGKKGYLFSIGLGSQTDTLDPSGRVIETAPVPSDLDARQIETVLESFRGHIEQVPPAYSALKVNGMPLYEYMRATGTLPIDIESKRRNVTIHSLELIEFNNQEVVLRVLCSKGTYVRSLARDIAHALGTCGTCTKLRREIVEPWNVSQALKVETNAEGRVTPPESTQLSAVSLPPWSMIPHLRKYQLDPEHKTRFLSGNPIELSASHLVSSAPTLSEEPKSACDTTKCFVQCEDVSYLCEISALPDDEFIRLQPRKRIS